MVVPVAGTMILVELSGGVVTTSEHGRYRFVPLRQGRGAHGREGRE
jgi:protein-L-isoaspartate(D-aspartate) O-methyltransferase